MGDAPMTPRNTVREGCGGLLEALREKHRVAGIREAGGEGRRAG